MAGAEVEVWVSDRDGDQVVGLDRNLLFVRALDVRAPLELEARGDGGVWVVSAAAGQPLGRHELTRWDAQGIRQVGVPLAPVLDLARDETGRALVVEMDPAGERVALIDDLGTTVFQRGVSGAICVAARAGRILAGTAGGDLVAFDLGVPGSPEVRRSFGGMITDVAPGPFPGEWWVLDAQGVGRLARIDARLRTVWSRRLDLHALHLAAVPGEERVWVADTTQPYVRRYGPDGVLEIDRSDMPLGGLDRATAWALGSALFTAPGALLRLDGQGQNAPGQAGFEFLVDVSAVH